MVENAFLIRLLEPRDMPAVASIHCEGWQTAYASFMDPAFLATRSPQDDQAWMSTWIFDEQKPLIGFVAEGGGEVQAFVLAGVNEGRPPEYDGELYKLFVRPAWQGHGIGQKLMQTALAELRRQGFKRVCIWTFAQAHSGAFYRKLGYTIVRRDQTTFGGETYPVDIYGGDL
jgi:GNAT superfamily N-acetyltransferase